MIFNLLKLINYIAGEKWMVNKPSQTSLLSEEFFIVNFDEMKNKFFERWRSTFILVCL